MLVGDPWMLTLGAYGGGARGIAALLLKAQVLTYKHRGHIIDLSDRKVKEALVATAYLGNLPEVYARCSRCGCLAMLRQWCAYSYPYTAQTMLDSAKYKQLGREFYAFLEACPGDQVAADIAVVLGVADDLED